MVDDFKPLGRRHRRSAAARQRRNALRRDRQARRIELRDNIASNTTTEAPDPLKLLNYYAVSATTFRDKQRERCLENLSDGSAKPSACRWFQQDYESINKDNFELPVLKSILSDLTTKALATANTQEDLQCWINLEREDQSKATTMLEKLSGVVHTYAEELAVQWASALKVSPRASENCSIRAMLLQQLLIATKSPEETEDLLICEEISKGCRIGVDKPIEATGLWPTDGGPKHSGYGLSLAAANAWKNYRSCTPCMDEVVKTLEKEVNKGHMRKTCDPPSSAVLTKLACVVKPSGAIRLIDDLRRSGVNERVRCEETIALSGLSSAAYILSEMKRRLPRGEKLLWIESDISSGFRHIPVHVEDQRYLVNFVDGCYYQHLRLPFGLRSSPLLWCRLMAAVHRVTKRMLSCDTLNGTGMIYVDDVGWVTSSSTALQVLMSILLVEESIGLQISYEKLHVTKNPHNLGYRWNLEDLTVTLPHEKRIKLISELSEIIESGSSKTTILASMLDRVTGRLTWATQIAPMYSAELSPFYALQAVARKHHLQHLHVGPTLAKSAKIFSDLLQQPAMASTTASQLLGWVTPASAGAVVVADASLSGLGGVVFNLDNSTEGYSDDSVEWYHVSYDDQPLIFDIVAGEDLSSSDIGPLELLASVIGIVRALDKGISTVTVLSDNVATVACINRRRAKSVRMNETMKRLRQSWPCLGYTVIADHVKGETNKLADFLSRSTSSERVTVLHDIGTEFDTLPILERLVGSLK